MEFGLWIGFAAASLVLAIVPGPGVATIVGIAVGSGRRAALAAVAGMALGNAIAISLSLAGAGVLLAASAFGFTLLKWAGAAYLIGIGLWAIHRSGGDVEAAVPRRPIGPRAAFWTTVLVGTFHPKTVLFFVAFATQFITADAPYAPQAAILVATFTGIAAITDSGYALAASRLSRFARTHVVRRWLQRAGGSVLVGAGIATAAMRR